MKKYIKLFIFFMIIFISPNVFATSYNVTNKIRACYNCSTGTYSSTEIANTGTENRYNVNTRYNGKISTMTFFLSSDDWDWDYNTKYTVTLTMATDDWRNSFMGPIVKRTNSDGSIPSTATNMYVTNTFKFVSYRNIKFDINTGGTMGVNTKFYLYSGNISSTAFTGVSNWNLSSVVISTTTSAPTVTPTPTPTPVPTPTPAPDFQDIINNANRNTQDIISNNNSNSQNIINNERNNTQDIINNNSQNTADIIENANKNSQDVIENSESVFLRTANILRNKQQDSCSNFIPFDLAYGYRFKWNGEFVQADDNYYTTDYVPFTNSSLAYTITDSNDTNIDEYICFYDSNKILLSNGQCTYLRNRTSTAPSGTAYFRLSSKKITTNVWYGNTGCKNRIDANTDAINNVNNSINNDNVDNGVGSTFFSDFTDNSHGLTSIITSPLNAIQSLTNSTCTPLSIPIPFTNSNVSLPCMTQVYTQRIPTIYNIWKVVSFGIISYFICIDIFHIVKGFKDPESDKVEVVDL